MIDQEKFALLTKKSEQSFVAQKLVIKKLTAGKQVNCEQCHQPLKMILPKDRSSVATILCPKGCTDICLEVS